MIDAILEVTDNGLIEAYLELCKEPDSFINESAKRTMERLEPAILEDFQREPDSVALPITFTTPRQRRYIMAQKRAGNIPGTYPRSHAISEGWKLFVVYTPGQLTSIYMSNPRPEAIFVEGIHQQPFMAVTGWLYVPDLEEKWSPIIEDNLETDLIKAFYAVGK